MIRELLIRLLLCGTLTVIASAGALHSPEALAASVDPNDLSGLHKKIWDCTDLTEGRDACLGGVAAAVSGAPSSVRLVFGGDSFLGETPDGILLLAKVSFTPFSVSGMRFQVDQWPLYVLLPSSSAAWNAWKGDNLAFSVAKPVVVRGAYTGLAPSSSCPIGGAQPCLLVFSVTDANPIE